MPLQENSFPEADVETKENSSDQNNSRQTFYSAEEVSSWFQEVEYYDVPPDELPQEKEKSFFGKARDWIRDKFENVKEAFGKVVEAIRNKLPHSEKGYGLFSRLETRLLGGKDAYNKLYSNREERSLPVKEANKAILEKENQPSNVMDELKKQKVTEKDCEFQKEEVTAEFEAGDKRYFASAKTLSVDGIKGTMAVFSVESSDRLHSLKITGQENRLSKKEFKNFEKSTESFKKVTDQIKKELEEGKSTDQILKSKPYKNKDIDGGTVKRGFFDLDKDNVMKVTYTEMQSGLVNLSIYNTVNDSSANVRGAESLEAALSEMSTLIDSSIEAERELDIACWPEGHLDPSEDEPENNDEQNKNEKDKADLFEDVYSHSEDDPANKSEQEENAFPDKDTKEKEQEVTEEPESPGDNEEQTAEPTEDKKSDERAESETPAEPEVLNDNEPLNNSLDEKEPEPDVNSVPRPAENAEEEAAMPDENEAKEENEISETEPVAVVSEPEPVPATDSVEKAPEKEAEPVEQPADEGFSVGDIVQKDGYNFRIVKMDEVAGNFNIKPVTFDDTKGYWISDSNAKVNSQPMERLDDYSVVEKRDTHKLVKNEPVITEDGRIGIYIGKNKVMVEGQKLSYSPELLRRYDPDKALKNEERQEKEPPSKEDILAFSANGRKEESPSLDNMPNTPSFENGPEIDDREDIDLGVTQDF